MHGHVGRLGIARADDRRHLLERQERLTIGGTAVARARFAWLRPLISCARRRPAGACVLWSFREANLPKPHREMS